MIPGALQIRDEIATVPFSQGHRDIGSKIIVQSPCAIVQALLFVSLLYRHLSHHVFLSSSRGVNSANTWRQADVWRIPQDRRDRHCRTGKLKVLATRKLTSSAWQLHRSRPSRKARRRRRNSCSPAAPSRASSSLLEATGTTTHLCRNQTQRV